MFLNVRTYRFTGHYVGDPQVYRDKTEVRELAETHDPIDRLRARLGIADDEFAALDEQVQAEVDASVEFAKAGTDPAPGGRAQVGLRRGVAGAVSATPSR